MGFLLKCISSFLEKEELCLAVNFYFKHTVYFYLIQSPGYIQMA